MIKKKNRFWTFCFSFIPGAAEMYMGFTKMGVSLLTAFLTICAIMTIIEMIPFIFLALGVWIFSFFHARNLATLTEDEMKQINDCYLFVEHQTLLINLSQKYKQWLAAILILCGGTMIWNYLVHLAEGLSPRWFSYINLLAIYGIPKVVMALFIIFIGVKLFNGEKLSK